MLQTCVADQQRGRKAGVRDAAIIALLATSDFDVAQIMTLKQSDFDVREGAFHDRPALPQLAKDHLVRWLNARSGIKSKSLFLALSLYGDFSNKGIPSRKVIADMLEGRAKQAGIANFSPHNLRHSAISEMRDAGIDGVTIRDITGHSGIETTANYDRRGDERKAEAAAKRDLPI